MRIVFNITTSLGWKRKPVGIVRVERETFKQCYRLSHGNITTVTLRENNWYIVPEFLIEEYLDESWGDINGYYTFPKDVIKEQFRPQLHDKFISLGSDWSYNIPDKVKALYPGQQNLITACYDLIPLIFPEFTPQIEFFEQFKHHYEVVRTTAEKVFAISELSKNDLLEYWERTAKYLPCPEIKAIPLAGLQFDKKVAITSDEEKLFKEILTERGYVIFVSTLEARKNHILLAHIWKDLYEELGDDCPRLLIVGMKGWGTDDLINELSKMDATLNNKIVWKEGISDNLLLKLYKNCLFAVHPSVYEGWGLAATEAMTFGKVCVVSNNSAMPEATQFLVPSFHPHDFLNWKAEIKKLITDVSYREKIEQNVQNNFINRNWESFGEEFYEWVIS